MSGLILSPEELKRWQEHKRAYSHPVPAKYYPDRIPIHRKQKAVNLYKKTGSISCVCKQLSMARKTCKKILNNAGMI